MMHGRQILLLWNPDNQARIIPLRVKPHHPLFLVLCLNSLLHLRLHNHSHKLRLSLLLDRQAHMYMAIILVTHTTPSPLRIKVLQLRQFLSRTHQVSKMGSSERTASGITLVKLRF